MAAPELPEGLPWWIYYWQYVFGGVVFIASMVGLGAREWRKGRDEGRSSAPTVVLEQAELADMSAVRNLKPALETIPVVVQSVAEKIDGLVLKTDSNGAKIESILLFLDFDRSTQRDHWAHLEHRIGEVESRLERIDRNVEYGQRDRDRWPRDDR